MGTTFNIKNYDTGGWGAIKGDGKLTGSEVIKARKDGWVVFEGFDGQKNKAPKNTTMAKFEIRFTELMQDPAAGVKRYYRDIEKPYSTVGTTGKRNNCLLFDCCK